MNVKMMGSNPNLDFVKIRFLHVDLFFITYFFAIFFNLIKRICNLNSTKPKPPIPALSAAAPSALVARLSLRPGLLAE